MKRPPTVAPDWAWDEVSNLDYAHASVVLGIPVGSLKEMVSKGDVESSVIGKHRLFSPANIRAIRAASLRPAKTTPAQVVPAYAEDDVQRAKLRAALIRAAA